MSVPVASVQEDNYEVWGPKYEIHAPQGKYTISCQNQRKSFSITIVCPDENAVKFLAERTFFLQNYYRDTEFKNLEAKFFAAKGDISVVKNLTTGSIKKLLGVKDENLLLEPGKEFEIMVGSAARGA